MSVLTDRQVLTITRAVVLLGRFGSVLSDHEQQLVDSVGDRFRRHGRDTFVTGNEWPVIEEAVAAMEAVRAQRMAQQNTVAEDAAGVRAGCPQPAA